MKVNAKELREKVLDRVQGATRQIQGMEDEVQKLAKSLQEKLVSTQADGLKRIDGLLKTVALTDFVDRLKAIDLAVHGGELRKDVLDRLGLASRTEMEALAARVETLEKKSAEPKAAPKARPAPKAAPKARPAPKAAPKAGPAAK